MPKSKSKKKPGRRAALSRERVVACACDLADKDGIAGLSMRKLAQALGVEAMSLYNHIKNKDDLLDALVERVVADIALPSLTEDWQTAMRNRAQSAHAVLMQHHWATQLMMSRVNIGPLMLTYVDATIGCLRAAGFSFALADHAWNALDSYLYGFTLQQLNFPFEPDEYADVAENFIPQLPMEQYPHLMGMSLEVMEKRHDGLHDLGFGLELLLDGLETLRVGLPS